MGRTMRGLKPSQFVPLYQGAVAISEKLESWIKTWWGENLNNRSEKYWFEHKRDNLLWYLPMDVAETALELLLESRLHQP